MHVVSRRLNVVRPPLTPPGVLDRRIIEGSGGIQANRLWWRHRTDVPEPFTHGSPQRASSVVRQFQPDPVCPTAPGYAPGNPLRRGRFLLSRSCAFPPFDSRLPLRHHVVCGGRDVVRRAVRPVLTVLCRLADARRSRSKRASGRDRARLNRIGERTTGRPRRPLTARSVRTWQSAAMPPLSGDAPGATGSRRKPHVRFAQIRHRLCRRCSGP